MKTNIRLHLAALLASALTLVTARAQLFQGTNAPGTGTNFTFTLSSGATNLCLAVTNNSGAAYSQVLLKYGSGVTDSDYDFVAQLAGVTNAIYLERPEALATNYSLRVRTPAASALHGFRVRMTTNITGLRTSLPPSKPPGFAATDVLTNGQWHYFRVELPTNSAGWRLVLNSTNLAAPADFYVRRGLLPDLGSFTKRVLGSSNATLVFLDTEATMGAYFIGIRQPVGTNRYSLFAETNLLTTLAWDPGTVHFGTQVYTNANTNGGSYYFKITTQNTSVGAWRTALYVTNGEANVFLRQGSFAEDDGNYPFRSQRVGPDGFTLHSSQFAAGQDWFILVEATPGAQFRLFSGEAYVLNLGTLAPPGSAASSTNVIMGAEGMRFFRTTTTPGTLAWRLWLNGAANDILVKKTAVPHPLNVNTYDLRQARQMLVVPSYLVGGDQYFVGVADAPGAAVNLDSRQQTVVDVPFSSTTPLAITGYGYVTYRISVPVQQIAWLTSVRPTVGDANVSVRRDVVPNEWNNDAFSEVAGATTDSISLVPPTLTDGTFFVTIYGLANYTCTFATGNPIITDVPFISTTMNDDPARVGWRYYRVPDIASQLGRLGWDLFLQSQPPGTELALRRNFVPGRWNYRPNNSPSVASQGYVDYSGPEGFIQRPGHQADIWYIGVYNPNTALGPFVLNLRELTGAPLGFDGASARTNVVNQPPDHFNYFRIEVPPGALGWDIRLTNVTSGDPRLVVRRDLLPDSLSTHAYPSGGWGYYYDDQWRSGYQWGATTDWTGLYYNPAGVTEYGRIIAVGMGNPLEPGTYYVGVLNPANDDTPMSYTLVSRGIGPGLAIPVASLAFSNGVANIVNLPAREAAYFQITVPTNRESWKFRLTTNSGEVSFILQKGAVPNVVAGGSAPIYLYGGRLVQKPWDEQYLLLPTSQQTNIPAGTYYAAVVSEGQNPNRSQSRIGSGNVTATLATYGVLVATNLGTLSGPDLTRNGALAGGEVQTYQFSVPAGTLAMEVRLENRVGNPRMTLRSDTFIPSPYDGYGNDGGTGYLWQDTDLINVANPVTGVYTLTVDATTLSGGYSNASYTVRIHRLTASPLAFDGGVVTVGGGHLAGTWRYYTITVPSNALGWDLRLTNVSSGDPRLSVRRSLAPDSLGTHAHPAGGWGWYYDNNWPTGYQWAATYDFTGYIDDANGTNRFGHTLQMGMGNPLAPGNYLIGIINSLSSGYGTNDLRYTLASRGIGPGFTIPVTPLAFTNGMADITNLRPREAAYFSVVVPTNLPGWKLRLGTNLGESLLILLKDALPNIQAGGTAPYHLYGGRQMQKVGHEHYAYLPINGQSNIVAGTYYLAVASEGVNPRAVNNNRIGTNNIAAKLHSVGVLTPTSLGAVSPGTDIVVNDSLEGGEVRPYQFTVLPGTLSLEVHLENRVANPRMTLRADARVPQPINTYGNDGGQTYQWQDNNLILLANPSNGTYSLTMMADYTGPGGGSSAVYSNSTYTVRIHAVGAVPLAFDGGSITVTDHAPNTWRYYLVTNTPNAALGWDVRLTNVFGGDPRLVIRRETLPDSLNNHTDTGGGWAYPWTYTIWPTGYQWGATYDWTGYYYDANGTNQYGHILQMGTGNPLTNGNYYIGVLNGIDSSYGTNTMRYTLTTRGIGPGYTIPVTPLTYAGGSISNSALPVREAAYYSVDVPTNQPSWKIRLGVGSGDTLLMVQRNYLPNVSGNNYLATDVGGGFEMQKVGNEHFVLLPAANQTNIPAGRYYLCVASEGRFPSTPGSRAGTNASTYLLQSLGALPVDDLGSIPPAGVARTNSVEGGEIRAYRFSVPAGMSGIEVRLDHRVGNPYLGFRRGLLFPYPNYYYGYNSGNGPEWSAPDIVTLASPAVTNYTLVVQGGSVGNIYPDADYVLRVLPTETRDLAFDPTMEGCEPGGGEFPRCTNSIYCAILADDERDFYRCVVPAALPDGTAVIGWRLTVSNLFGNAMVRVRQDLLPSDAVFFTQTAFISEQAVIVPPFLTPGTWYVEVKGNGPTSYCLRSAAVRLQRPPWTMPGLGEPITTPGLTNGPLFGDSGVTPAGAALPGDGGTDLEQGSFHYYAVNVPTNNGGLFRVVLEAISGDPDAYFRARDLPTISHRYDGVSGTIYERSLTAGATEYANWVPNQGRYETGLSNGVWFVAVRAGGNSNCRYRLRLSTGSVTNLELRAGATNLTLAARDWRYARFWVPTNAPTQWTLQLQQHVGDVVMYLRDVIPPGQATHVTDYRDWQDDNKNHGPYPNYDPAGIYTNYVPPLRPGSYYYVGFRAVNDATFTLTSSTNGTVIGNLPTIAFYGGSVTNYLSPGAKVRYRIDVPADGTRWISISIHSNVVDWFLDQGTLPTETSQDHAYSGNGMNVGVNQYLLNPLGWPWLPAKSYYLTVTNTSTLSQPFYWRMDGRNCMTDDFDADGLPDCWELLYFPSIYSYTGASDPDNDGNNNLLEYQDGTIPIDPTSMLARLNITIIGPGSVGVVPLQATYPWGTIVTLTPTPVAPNVFYGWSGPGISGSANPLLLPMTTNRNLTASFGPDYGPHGQTRADYRFQSNLVSSVGTPPDLTYINAGHFFTNQLVDNAPRTTLRWPSGRGLQLQPTVPVFGSNAYTIVALFKFDSVSSWRRILDTKSATVDQGLYVVNGYLNFYPSGAQSPAVCMTNETWHQVAITRDLAGQVAVYCDGKPQFSFNDLATGYAVVSGPKAMRFFKDETTDDSAGSVCRIRTWADALSPAEIAALDRCPSITTPILLINPLVTSNNRFRFTITGPAGPLYRLQVSSNFVDWVTVTNFAAFPGAMPYTNATIFTTPGYRYFRALIP